MEWIPHRIELYRGEGVAAVYRTDTGEQVDVRELLAHERQGELPLDASSEDAKEEAAEPDAMPAEEEDTTEDAPPYEIEPLQMLMSIDTGRRVRVLAKAKESADGHRRWTVQGITKQGTDTKHKPKNVTEAALLVAYRPETPPAPPEPPTAPGEPAPPPA